MDPINYDVGVNELFYQVNNSNRNVDILNQKMLFDYYKNLFMMRHNILHYFVLKMLGKPWKDEQRIIDFFNIDMPSDFERKTPDILCEIKEDLFLMIDVSISVDIHKTELQKKEKYQPIVDFLCDNGINIKYIHINFSNNLNNMSSELAKLYDYARADFDFVNFTGIQRIIGDKKEWCDENSDKEFFNQMKIEEFSKKNVDIDDTIFMDELKFTNIGMFKDLDIDYDSVKEHNHKNELYNSIDNFIVPDNFEDDLCIFLKKTLEEKTHVYQKYKDLKLDKEQFQEASDFIYESNKENFQAINPKPTHHLMIPIDEQQGISDEQQSIRDFLKSFDKDFDHINADSEGLTDKAYLIRDIGRELDWCLNESLDKEINDDFYYERNFKYNSFKQEYKKVRDMVMFHSLYKKRSKIPKKLKLALNIPIIKEYDLSDNYREIIKNLKEIFLEIPNTNFSFRDFLRMRNYLKEEDDVSYIKRNKTLKLSFKDISVQSREAYRKTGINKEILLDDEKYNKNINSVSFINEKSIQDKLDLFHSVPLNPYISRLDEFLMDDSISFDDPGASFYKKRMKDNYMDHYPFLKDTIAFGYSQTAHMMYQQLMHFSQINLGEKSFSLFNGGFKNFLVIVVSSYTGMNDEGQPFMSIIRTKKPEVYNDGFFGKTYTYEIGDGFFYVLTNWRRLRLSKITYLRDVFYSVLSSTMNTLMSAPKIETYIIGHKIKKIFSLRTIIGHATNQKIGELLMDTRYAYMSSFSIYTNIGKLLIEKFGPPYTTCMEVWIVNKLLTRLLIIHEKVKNKGILQHTVEMENNYRNVNTIGGSINLPSLWIDDQIMYDVTEILDEAFIYVHTMKEPSNIFHENIKAIKTIIKFQKEYDCLPKNVQTGLSLDIHEIENYLLLDTQIGCSVPVILLSTKYTIAKEKPFFKKIIHEINEESIGELISTKAVISDINRQVVKIEPTKRDIEKDLRRKKKIYGKKVEEYQNDLIKYKLTSESKYYKKNKPRQKVIETVLDILEKDHNLDTVVKYANKFLIDEKGKVVADICIKAQYGSKREFYVINMGAKALARVSENFFKKISQNSPNEAISIPGDKKIIHMQKMLDRIYYNDFTRDHKLIYVNGDCTKWSACETMSSFMAMTKSFKDYITPRTYELLMSTFVCWNNKEIQVPIEIINKVIPTEKHNTLFLKTINNTGTIKSTQNFLQGMFNYSSSYKAVCCMNFVYYIWKKIYPLSNIIIEHMEHSDDYEILIVYETFDELEKFRALQKIMMRLHGYNDSDRKTSCQPYFMEFVSQLSFNGSMLYPQIKKSKEINLNLPCTSYKTDIDASLSRVGECQRVGCNLSYLYFFEKVHMFCVAEAYSILPNMLNNQNRSLLQLKNDPVELFGIPDICPIFFLFCRGNGNNYRLWMYGDKTTKNKISYLYNRSREKINSDEAMFEANDYSYSLYTPKFMYEMMNKTTQNLRYAMNYDYSNVQKFWEEHISYRFIKPKEITKLISWIKCMFYNQTFLEAYSKTNRTKMTMRISSFVKSKIIREKINLEDFDKNPNAIKNELLTIKNYYEKVSEELCNEELTEEFNNEIIKITTKCDPTYSAIYEILDKTQISYQKANKERTIQVVAYTPNKYKTINIINSPSNIIQYMYNNDDFMEDKRHLISRESLEKDMLEMENRIDKKLLNNPTTMGILSIYNDLMINYEKPNIMITYNRDRHNDIIDTIITSMENNLDPGKIIAINHIDIITIRDPLTGEPIYSKGHRLTKDYFGQCVDNLILLYLFLHIKLQYTISETINYIKQITFTIKINEKEKEFFNYIDILRKLNIDYLNTFDYSTDDKKKISFLKIIFLDDYTILDEIVNSVYSYSYKYIIRDNPINGIYYNTTLVSFTYFNTTCEAYYNPNHYTLPLLFINKHYQSVAHILYNIALRLVNKITDSEFQHQLNTNRMKGLYLSEIKNLDKLIQKYSLKAIISRTFEHDKYVFLNKTKEEEIYLPIFQTNKTLTRGGDIKMNIHKVRPQCDTENMTIKLGKSKLFTVPFWKCKQYHNMSIDKTIIIDNIPFNNLLENQILEKYLFGNPNDIPLFKITEPSDYLIVKKIQKEIKKHKLYDLDFNNLTEDKQNIYNDLLRTPPDIHKTYEKTKSLHNNVFIENIQQYVEDLEEKQTKRMIEEKNKEEVSNMGLDFDLNIGNWGLEVEKFENDINQNIDNLKEKDPIGDFLLQGLDNLLTNDDFLVENDYVDMDDIIFDDDLNYIEKPFGDFGGFDVSVRDIFVVKPKQYFINKNEGAGYLMNKIINKQDLFLIQFLKDKDYKNSYDYLNIGDFIQELKNFEIIYYNDNFCLNNWILLYKLLCQTYLIRDEDYKTDINFLIENRKIICYLNVEQKIIQPIYDNLVSNRRIIKDWEWNNNKYFSIKTILSKFLLKHEENVSKRMINKTILNIGDVVLEDLRTKRKEIEYNKKAILDFL